MDNIKFGKLIKKLRENKKMTQKELGEKLNITNKAISKWERGISIPDVEMFPPLSEVLGVSVEELLNGELNIDKNDENKNFKHKWLKILFVFFILLVIYLIFFAIIQNNKDKSNNILILQNDYLPIPDRIIYKNDNNKYFVITKEDKEFSLIYEEISLRVNSVIEGKVIDKKELNKIKKNESFLEFDYNTKSKNKIFPLEQEVIAMITMFTDSGQISKTKITEKEKLINRLDELTVNIKSYIINYENNSYMSSERLKELPTDLNLVEKDLQKKEIYHLIISDEQTYDKSISATGFNPSTHLPDINFDENNVVMTISQNKIKCIEQNVGNLKYELYPNALDYYSDYYSVHILIVSKITNINCIYYTFSSYNENSPDVVNYEEIENPSVITYY